MERRLEIEAFRNIGFDNEQPKKESLLLNRSLEKGHMGDLVILIGANNSGKSNVLAALKSFRDSDLSNRDITDLYMDDHLRNPSLSLTVKDDNSNIYSYKTSYNLKEQIINPSLKIEDYKPSITLTSLDKKSLKFELSGLSYVETQFFNTRNISNAIEKIDWNNYIVNDILPVFNMALGWFHNTLCQTTQNIGNMKDCLANNCPNFYNEYFEYLKYKQKINGSNSLNNLNEYFNTNYSIPFIPKIIEYEEKVIHNYELLRNYENLSESHFFMSVLNAINFEYNSIINAHNCFVSNNNIGVLKQLERKLNEKLKAVSESFNKLYYLDDSKYSFEFTLESSKIFFSLYRGTQTISLDYQSTGFKWFFNLYFNLLTSNSLNSGDILIMDEPATNLHVKGQEELRGFLKKFAIHYDITIVIATHSPFLIDMDYLDELRIVSSNNNISSIDNDFSTINIDDPDSLLPVKESLTVRNSVLLDPDETVIFVEGITDYNYLVGMKHVLGIDGITFLPIKGVGKTKEQQIEISKKLISIRKHHPILLADGDTAGTKVKELNNENSELKVITLTDIDKNLIEIEQVFSTNDLSKFGLIDNKQQVVKHSSTSSNFKNNAILNHDCVDSTTKSNFKKIFDFILDN